MTILSPMDGSSVKLGKIEESPSEIEARSKVIIERQQKIIELLEKELETLPEYVVRYQKEQLILKTQLSEKQAKISRLEAALRLVAPERTDFGAALPQCPGCKGCVIDV